MRIVVMDHVSLDGVMQGPGRPGEDDRYGFVHSGWATERSDETVGQAIGQRMAKSAGFLFGRRTYDDALQHWNSVPDSPFAAPLNTATKYVVTTEPDAQLAWPNSIAVPASSVGSDDAVNAIDRLRADGDGDLWLMGSSVLLHALQRRGLIDEYLLLIHPLVLGSGIRLFADGGSFETLRLTEPVRSSTTDVVIAAFEPIR